MPSIARISTARRKTQDRVARWVITLGGLIVIASVIAILLLIVGVTLPSVQLADGDELARRSAAGVTDSPRTCWRSGSSCPSASRPARSTAGA